MNNKIEFYTEDLDLLVKDNDPITSINGKDAFYYEKLDNTLSNRIKYHEYLYGLLKIAVENYHLTTMVMLKSYPDPNIDRESEIRYENEQLIALEKLQLLLDTILDDFDGIDIIREKAEKSRLNGDGYNERIVLKKVLHRIEEIKTNMAEAVPKVDEDKEYLKFDGISTEDYPTPMYIGDPNIPELRATNDPINCTGPGIQASKVDFNPNRPALANMPRYDEDID